MKVPRIPLSNEKREQKNEVSINVETERACLELLFYVDVFYIRA